MPKQEKDSWFILVVIAATLALYFAFLAVVGMNQAAGGVFALAALTGIPGMKRRKRQGGDVVYDDRDRHIERQALLFSLTAFYGGMILFGLVTGFWAGWETSVPLWKVFQVLWAVALVVWGLKAAFIIVLYRRGAHA